PALAGAEAARRRRARGPGTDRRPQRPPALRPPALAGVGRRPGRALPPERDRPLVPGAAAGGARAALAGPAADLQAGRHLRGRVRGGDALLLLLLRGGGRVALDRR